MVHYCIGSLCICMQHPDMFKGKILIIILTDSENGLEIVRGAKIHGHSLSGRIDNHFLNRLKYVCLSIRLMAVHVLLCSTNRSQFLRYYKIRTLTYFGPWTCPIIMWKKFAIFNISRRVNCWKFQRNHFLNTPPYIYLIRSQHLYSNMI